MLREDPQEWRKLGKDDRPVELGLSWKEYYRYKGGMLIQTTVVLGLLGLAYWFGGWLFTAPFFGLLAVLCFLGAGGMLAWRMSLFKSRRVIFGNDGRISTPFGLPFHEKLTEVRGDHARIMSIEQFPLGHGEYGVRVITETGNVFSLANGLYEAEALKVTVMLNRALMEIRTVMANGPARSSSGKGPELVIN